MSGEAERSENDTATPPARSASAHERPARSASAHERPARSASAHERPARDARARRSIARVVAWYLGVAACWIAGSDWLGKQLFGSAVDLGIYQTFKGLFFVAITGGLLYLLVRDHTARLVAAERAGSEVSRALQRANGAMRWLANSSAASPGSEHEMLADFCRELVELGSYRSVLCVLGREVVASAGMPDPPRRLPDDDPSAEVAREGRPVLSRGVRRNPRTSTLERGDHTVVTLPIAERDVDGLGALVIETDHPRGLRDDELSLLTETATVLAVILRTRRERLARLAAEERLRLALEASGHGIFDLDLRTGEALVTAPPAHAHALGYDAPVFRERFDTWLDRVHPDDRMSSMDAFAGNLGDDSLYRSEFRVRGRNGAWLWVRATGRVVERDRAGRPLRFLGTHADITQRRRAEEALDESRERYRSLFEHGQSVMLILDPDDGAIVDANPAAVEFYGWSRDELLSKNIADINPLPSATLASSLALAKSGSARFEFRHRVADGSLRDVESFAGVMPVEGRRLVYAVIHDVSARKLGERRLADRARRDASLRELSWLAARLDEPALLERALTMAEELTRSGVAFVHYVDGEALELAACSTATRAWSESATRRCSVADAGTFSAAARSTEPSVLDPYPWEESPKCIPPAHHELERLVVIPIAESGASVMTWSVGNKAEPYTDDELETLHVVATTAWRLIQRGRLEERLRKLSLAVEQSPESIVITDASGTIEYVNEAFTAMSGFTRDEVLGRGPTLFRAEDDASRELERALSEGRSWRGRLQNRRKDGREYLVFAKVSPIHQLDGRITHHVALEEDITEKTRLGRELDRHRHHLEELVATRTAELADARELAEQANRAKSAFLANMSHEIRTPLNAILGLTHLLRREETNETQLARLGRVHAAGVHLLAVINDILDLSKIEAGRLELERVPCDARALVDEAASIVSVQAAAKHLDVRVEHDPRIGPFLGDPTRIRQALVNYAGNAVKFTERGEVSIRSELVEERVDGECGEPQDGEHGARRGTMTLRFVVEDTGSGMDAATQARLFRSFEQADSSSTRRHGGTGLGLAITRKLAESMGGSVGVWSEPGRGSRFWITFPAERIDPPAVVAPISAAPARPARGPGRRVLVVEDNAINQEVARELLESLGYSVAVACDGEDALELARREQFGLVLMDLQMPRMDGLDATRAIRTLPGWEHVPILAMTASTFAEDRAACEAAGMTDFLSKPVDPAALEAVLRRWLPAPEQAREGSLREVPARPDSSSRRRPDAPSDGLDVLRALPGFDVDAGLSRLGDVDRYAELLLRFVATSEQSLVELRGALDGRDFATARRLAHTLKGAAANLGAVELATEAAAVEESTRREVSTSTDRISDAFERLQRAARELPRPPGHDGPAKPNDPASGERTDETERVLAALVALVARSDTAALSLVREHRDALHRALGEARARELEDALAEYEFERARKVLGRPLG